MKKINCKQTMESLLEIKNLATDLYGSILINKDNELAVMLNLTNLLSSIDLVNEYLISKTLITDMFKLDKEFEEDTEEENATRES